jgi:aldehyde dehydrogenase (NAD+)
MGRYHGRYSFETFSHRKSVMKRSLLIDPSLRYPPYPVPLRMLKNVMRWIL